MLGSVQHAPCGRQNIRAACEALTTAIAAGVFLCRSEAEWELAFHYPTLADWIEFLERPKTGSIEADPARFDAALADFTRSDVELVVTEDTVFSLLERKGAD